MGVFENLELRAQQDKFLARAYASIVFHDEDQNTIISCNPVLEFQLKEIFDITDTRINLGILQGTIQVVSNQVNNNYRITNLKSMNRVIETFLNNLNKVEPWYLLDQPIEYNWLFETIDTMNVMQGRGYLITGIPAAKDPKDERKEILQFIMGGEEKTNLRK